MLYWPYSFAPANFLTSEQDAAIPAAITNAITVLCMHQSGIIGPTNDRFCFFRSDFLCCASVYIRINLCFICDAHISGHSAFAVQ